ncbi:myotubularin-related protein 14 isoform X1 [Centrocercus urophasianus]|uniref:myotubularin-related protein 14 isoform X1 n=1 Tax=Centrocercus urophasianus TaxID=9002 RepID=UPI001C6468F2|nr:myotubularin-related protein 14 isoform X1 [Centrocercus urophasianus]XP_042736081.1 myotubularin-related protein 14 isoform X1 [Lagopus leucura]XP_048813058.1 myotubularin-related protein 14 isoform X1 [Lagopus muta]XP_052535034.1 myotubularin-related protein 14 isoform X1 [Tympanuchus pallidicinctus]
MAVARGCPPAGSGDRGLAELLLEFSRAQYRAKDGGGAAAAKVERIERRCLELFGRDYRYSVISNAHGEVCAHYPRHIVLLERDNAAGRDPFESTVQVGKLQDLINRSKMARCRGRFVCPVILYKGKHICRSATLAGWGELYGRTGYNYIFSGGSDDAWADAEDISEEDSALRNADSQLFDKVRGHDIKLLRYLSVRYICDLMVENKKVKFGLNVTSSEKVDKAQRYADFTLLSIPYPGCEFFKEYKDRDYTAEGLIFNWKQDYVDAPLSIPASVTQSLSIDWSEYQSWDLVQQTQNYLKLLISIINSDDDSGLLVHCISGWDRTPLFISLLRLSLWADGLIHVSLEPSEILYLTVAYDWFLFGHMLVDRLNKGEEIFFFCFNFLKHITSEEFSGVKSQRRKSLPPGFTLEEICMLKQRDRGSTTSLSSDFSLGMESSPGAAGSFTYEAVELMPAGAQAQATWRKSSASSPQAVLWSRAQQSEDRLPSAGMVEVKSSSSSSSTHSDNFLRIGSSPLEVPRSRSADHSLPGSSVSTDFGSWQMVTGCGSIREQATLSADASLPCSFPDEFPNTCLLVSASDRESRLEEVRSAFLASYSRTIGLKAVPPSPSGAIGGLLEQFVRGVGLRGSSTL